MSTGGRGIRETTSIPFPSGCSAIHPRIHDRSSFPFHIKGIVQKTCAIGVTICATLLCGSSNPSGEGKIEPIPFDHSDEWAMQGGFAALADRRILTLITLFNARGYDQEHPDFQMHPVRIWARELVKTTSGNAIAESDYERPIVTYPRATSGDTAVEPEWAQRLTITVGPVNADLVGTNVRTIQSAVDYVARLGGGTVKILPGTYRLRNAVTLQSNIRLVGSGAETVLIKEPSTTTKLAEDSDWFDQEITLADATGFEIGDGVCLRGRAAGKNADAIVKRTMVARTGNRFKLDRALRENFWRDGNATASTLFPLVTGESITDIAIENLVLDGNRDKNANLDGNYAGCIWLQDCSRIVIRGVTARNYNGDGISWQVCHDVTVEDCNSENNAQLGLHPGSGSQRPILRNNRIVGNDIGIFFCWGVKYGLADRNVLENNRVGISIGHRDTDNLVCRNEILRSREVAILFRPEGGRDFAGHRNHLEDNHIVDTGGDNSIAVDIQGATEGVKLRGNRFEETRGPAGRTAIRLGPETRDIQLQDNRIHGFSIEVQRAQ